MNESFLIVGCVFLIVILIVLCIGILVYFRKKERRLQIRLQTMLDEAISGTFEDKCFDETKASAIESSMWRYLCDNQLVFMQLLKNKEQIQTLISDISHQAVTPISSIILYSQLLEEWQLATHSKDNEWNQDAIEAIESIREQVEKLDFLIQSLVKLSRLETGIISINVKEQSINAVLLAIKKQFMPKAYEKQIQLNIMTSNELAVFDLKWTIEAISNIVDNAIKYTSPEGQISIDVEMYSLFLRIDIKDNGVGISEEEQGNIFTRFYRSAMVSEKSGVGIGLYLAREVMKAQNGYIKVQSKLGEGSMFSVFLLKK